MATLQIIPKSSLNFAAVKSRVEYVTPTKPSGPSNSNVSGPLRSHSSVAPGNIKTKSYLDSSSLMIGRTNIHERRST